MYVREDGPKLSLQKQTAYENFSKIINWGRSNPVAFAEYMFGIKLLDLQAYAFMESWYRPFVLWLWTRAGGKTAVIAAFLMCKMLLVPNYSVYISAKTAPQAIISFKKIRDIALGRVASFQEVTDIFQHEVVTSPGNNGFKESQSGHNFRLYNGSELLTLSSNFDALRGLRGSVWYDEAGFITKETMDVVDQFINVDSNFRFGGDGSYCIPQQMPLQLIHTSSASSVGTPYYDKFKEYTKHMIAGDPNYFVCDFDAYTFLDHSTYKGDPMPSHLNVAKIKEEVEKNPEAADREYFNHFRRGAGKSAVVSEETLLRNSHVRPPVLRHPGKGEHKYIFCYDPARNYDNSVVGVFELIDDPHVGYKLDVVNVVSMVNTKKAKKTPLNMPDQLDVLRKMMVAYNGERAAEWENLEIYIDAGSGGGGRSAVADNLMFPWTDNMGVEHRGIIDPVDKDYEEDRYIHTDDAPIVHLLEPSKYKAKIFGALEELSKLNLITFTNYDGHSSELLLEDKSESSGFKEYPLTSEEIEALVQIEFMKTEISYMCRVENQTARTVSYDLVRERRNKMHDDRAYVLAMGAYALWEVRNKDLRDRKPKKQDDIYLYMRPAKQHLSHRLG